MTLVPNAAQQHQRLGKLVRITADPLGVGRLMPDLLLDPSARLNQKLPTLQRLTRHTAASVPATDFIDGMNIIEAQPQAPVQDFLLGFAAHERVEDFGMLMHPHLSLHVLDFGVAARCGLDLSLGCGSDRLCVAL